MNEGDDVKPRDRHSDGEGRWEGRREAAIKFTLSRQGRIGGKDILDIATIHIAT